MSARIVRTTVRGTFLTDNRFAGYLPGDPVVIVDAETWERRERAVAMLADWVDLHGTDTSQLTAETRALLAELTEGR